MPSARAVLTCFILTLMACKPEVMSTSQGSTEGAPAKAASKTEGETSALPLRLVSVRLVGEDVAADAPSAQQATTWLKSALLETPEFVEETVEKTATAVVTGTYRSQQQEARDGSGQRLGVAFFEVNIDVMGADGRKAFSPRTEALVGEALKDKTPPPKALASLVQSVAAEVARDLCAQLRVKHGTDDWLVSSLREDSDPGLLKLAIPAVRRRKLTAAAEALIALLKHEDRDIVNIAASALGDVGTASAVPALIECGTRTQAQNRLPVLYALGKLGGPQALIYLETLSKGADDPMVKEAAARALEEARKR